MKKVIVFDMDGTITDLYGYHEWLYFLQIKSTVPYRYADPIYNVNELNTTVQALKTDGWTIAIISWTAKNADTDYITRTRIEKIKWLQRYDFPYDELHIIPYGTEKSAYVSDYDMKILVDDEYKVRMAWKGDATIDAKKNIIPELKKILKQG